MSNIKYTHKNEWVVDTAITEYEFFEAVFDILEKNENLTNNTKTNQNYGDLHYFDLTSDFIEDSALVLPEFEFNSKENIPAPKPSTREIEIIPGQTIMDISIQEYEDFSKLFDILEENTNLVDKNELPVNYQMDTVTDFNLSFTIQPGNKILIENNNKSNYAVISGLSSNSIKLENPFDGIHYWEINKDFIIQ